MTVTIWQYGDPQPEGVTVVYNYDSRTRWSEWRLTERGWYCHTAYGVVPRGTGAYAPWRTIVALWGRLFSRPLAFGECIIRDREEANE